MNQYQIVFDGTAQPVQNTMPETWLRIFEVCEERGLSAELRRRTIIDGDPDSFLATVANNDGTTPGYMRFGNRVICPWQVIAEADFDRRGKG